ncbi:hypothetical protein EDF68_101389 [Ochrobactrum sp. BH3]|nr:hypothetical protein EDF68_101389 [Ochrobactrum sp. BH3]
MVPDGLLFRASGIMIFGGGVFHRCLSGLRNRFEYNILPKFVDGLVNLSIFFPARNIKSKNAHKILIDNSVLGYAITHETGWINTGKVKWGGEIDIDTGYAARIPVYDDNDLSPTYQSVQYIPAIAGLARKKIIQLFDSSELADERLTQPGGRFSGYETFDYSLLSGIQIQTIIDYNYSLYLGPRNFNLPSPIEQRRSRYKLRNDTLYKSILSALGEKNDQDAWHIATAEENGCYCFLTMDFKLIRNVRARKNHEGISKLKTKVMSPEEFGIEFGLMPIPPRFFSYHNASFPVEAGRNWPNSSRKKRNRRKREKSG